MTRILTTFFISFMITSTVLFWPQQVNSSFFPTGHPDIKINLYKPSFAPIHLDQENFNLLLDDIAKLPVLVNSTIFPHVTEVFMNNEEKLHNQYIEYIFAVYDMDKNVLSTDIASRPSNVPEITVEETVNVKPTPESQMSIIRQVTIWMPLYWNSTLPVSAGSIIFKIEDLNLIRTQILADQAVEALKTHKDKLVDQTPIGLIVLKMTDYDIARVTVTYEDLTTGNWVRIIDEIKTVQIIPEFPIAIVIASIAVGLMLGVMRLRNVRLY